jgi:hypothetical protein
VPTLVLPVLHIGVLAGQSQPLTADDIELRPWSDRDSAFLVTAYSDLQIQRWHVRTIDAAEALRGSRKEHCDGRASAEPTG